MTSFFQLLNDQFVICGLVYSSVKIFPEYQLLFLKEVLWYTEWKNIYESKLLQIAKPTLISRKPLLNTFYKNNSWY